MCEDVDFLLRLKEANLEPICGERERTEPREGGEGHLGRVVSDTPLEMAPQVNAKPLKRHSGYEDNELPSEIQVRSHPRFLATLPRVETRKVEKHLWMCVCVCVCGKSWVRCLPQPSAQVWYMFRFGHRLNMSSTQKSHAKRSTNEFNRTWSAHVPGTCT